MTIDTGKIFDFLFELFAAAFILLILFIIRSCKSSGCKVPVRGICRGRIRKTGRFFHFDYILFDYSFNGTDYKEIKCYDRRREANLTKDNTLEDWGFVEGKEYTIYLNPKKPERFTAFYHPKNQ